MKKTEFIFPFLVLLLSVVSLINNFYNLNIPSILISLIGIAGVILFYLKRDIFRIFLYTWIITQLLIIPGLWDVSQTLKIQFGFSMTFKNNFETGIYLNIVPIFYFIGFRILSVSTLVGERVTIRRFHKESKLANVLPIEGTVIKRVNLSGEKEWLLVDLQKGFDFSNSEIKSVFIKAKDERPLQKSKKRQLSYLRIIQEPLDDSIIHFNKEKYKFIDWVLIEGR